MRRSFRKKPYPARWPAWLYPKGSDVLPFDDATIGRNLANSAGRFAGLDPEVRARRLSEIGRMAVAARRARITSEQLAEWCRRGNKNRAAKMSAEERHQLGVSLSKASTAKRTPERRAADSERLRAYWASVTPERRQEIARMGAAAANAKRRRQQGEGSNG